jgi:hypothetical protein
VILRSALFFVSLAITPVAVAMPVAWTLNNVNFADGGTATGSFSYDADLNAYSAVSITTTPGSAFSGWTYGGQAIDQPQTASQLIATTSNALTQPNSVLFALRFDAPLANAGGVRNLLAGAQLIPPQGSYEVVCAVAGACAAPAARLLLSGNITAQVIPVPAAMWLFGSALGVMGWMRRKVSS